MNLSGWMKRTIYYSSILFITLVFTGCMNSTMIEHDPSAGFNGSFEKTKHHLPLNWTIFASFDYQKNYILSYDTLFVKDGIQSLKFDVLSVDTAMINQNSRTPGISGTLDVISGDQYKISFWIKNSGCEFKVKVGIDGGELRSNTLINTKEEFTEWTYFEYEYTVPEYLPFIRFTLNLLSPGTFWIDDVRLEKISN